MISQNFNYNASEDKRITPLISVIVPVFNLELYLVRCVNSILDQSYTNIEIVLVDDGSVDGSGLICDNFATQYPGRIHVLHLENVGVTKARIAGIRRATGEWIGFVDGDDLIESDMYARLMDNALSHRADISHCGYKTIVEDKETIHYFYDTGRIVEQDREKGLYDLVSGEYVEPGLCNKMYRRRLLEQVLESGEIDTSIKINEDLMLNFALFQLANKSIYEDFCPYHYIARKGSASRSEFRLYHALDPVRVRKWMLDHNDLTNLDSVLWTQFFLRSCGAANTILKHPEYYETRKILVHDMKVNRKKMKLLKLKQRTRVVLCIYFPHLYQYVMDLYWTNRKQKYE